MAKNIVITKDGVPTHLYSVLKKALLDRGLKPRNYLNPTFPIDLPTGEKAWQFDRLYKLVEIDTRCEHPWAFVMGDGEMKPAKCLKCGEYLSS